MLLIFETEWCGVCRFLNKEILSDRAVRAAISGCVKVRVNPEHNKASKRLADRFGVNSYPTIVVLGSPDAKRHRIGVTREDPVNNFILQFERAKDAASGSSGDRGDGSRQGESELARLNVEIRRNARDPGLYVIRAEHYRRAGQLKKAVADLEKAIRLSPRDRELYVKLVTVSRKVNVNKALRAASRLIALDPRDAEGYFMRGMLYYEQRNINKARRDGQKACDLGSDAACRMLER